STGATTPPPAEQKVSLTVQGKVLMISPAGYGREVWSGQQEAILSLAPWGEGRVLMGSSAQGRIYALESDGRVSEVARAPSSQVTALLAAGLGGRGAHRQGAAPRPGDVLVAGSNLGTLSVLRPEYSSSGTFESRVLDARAFSTWGRAAWRADLPRGTEVAISVRSGNTENPDRTWSGWSEELRDPLGSLIDRPSARFLQWRAVLGTRDPAVTPVLREVAITYLQRNLPPRIEKIEVQAPGVAFRKVPTTPAGPPQESKPGGSSQPDVESAVRRTSRPQMRRGFDPGARSVTWQASDPNDDELVYDVYFRAVDEKTWKPIRTRIGEQFASVDSTAMPDGIYQFRVVASDAASNPGDQALSAETVSAQFDVDNTPPRVEAMRASIGDAAIRLEFTVADTFSLVREAAYSIDAGEWNMARPLDGLHDALEERYEIEIAPLPPGEHTVAVRATDAAGNVGAGRVVIEVP
ncbi:MAG: hypothetical protein ACE5JH_04730, partial [Acidobacteriota bacterium]